MPFDKSAARVLEGAPSDHQAESWMRTLEDFGIPFICYSGSGGRCYTSSAARSLLREEWNGDAISKQADRVAEEGLGRVTGQRTAGRFTRARDLPACGSHLQLAVYLARPAINDVGTVVVICPGVGSTADGSELGGLTPRERDVTRLISAGLATKEIACQLGISPHTARHHTERVFAKLGVRSRAGVAGIHRTSSDHLSATRLLP